MMKSRLIVTAVLALTISPLPVIGFSRDEGNGYEHTSYSSIDNNNKQLPFNNGKTQMTIKTDEVILFDFASNDAISVWRPVNDTVMGGISSSRMERSPDGKAVFTGEISLENNGGFASVQGPEIQQPLGAFEGIAIRVKGDGKRYKCGLRTDDLFDGVSHQAGFKTKTGEWQIVKIPFTDFIPTYHGRRLSNDKRMTPGLIKKLGFLISERQDGAFRLEIDWIKAYR
jgi:monofunctional biosynthetic peptidoglycan transglycosylase